MDHGLQTERSGICQAASGAVLKGGQMTTMPEGGSSLTAGLSKAHQHSELGIIASSSLG